MALEISKLSFWTKWNMLFYTKWSLRSWSLSIFVSVIRKLLLNMEVAKLKVWFWAIASQYFNLGLQCIAWQNQFSTNGMNISNTYFNQKGFVPFFIFSSIKDLFQHLCQLQWSISAMMLLFFYFPKQKQNFTEGLFKFCMQLHICHRLRTQLRGFLALWNLLFSLVAPLQACIPWAVVLLLILPPRSSCEALGADQALGGGGSSCEMFLSTQWLQESVTQLTNPKKSNSWANQTSQLPNTVATGKADNERGSNPCGFLIAGLGGVLLLISGASKERGMQGGAEPSQQWNHQAWLIGSLQPELVWFYLCLVP